MFLLPDPCWLRGRYYNFRTHDRKFIGIYSIKNKLYASLISTVTQICEEKHVEETSKWISVLQPVTWNANLLQNVLMLWLDISACLDLWRYCLPCRLSWWRENAVLFNARRKTAYLLEVWSTNQSNVSFLGTYDHYKSPF